MAPKCTSYEVCHHLNRPAADIFGDDPFYYSDDSFFPDVHMISVGGDGSLESALKRPIMFWQEVSSSYPSISAGYGTTMRLSRHDTECTIGSFRISITSLLMAVF